MKKSLLLPSVMLYFLSIQIAPADQVVPSIEQVNAVCPARITCTAADFKSCTMHTALLGQQVLKNLQLDYGSIMKTTDAIGYQLVQSNGSMVAANNSCHYKLYGYERYIGLKDTSGEFKPAAATKNWFIDAAKYGFCGGAGRCEYVPTTGS